MASRTTPYEALLLYLENMQPPTINLPPEVREELRAISDCFELDELVTDPTPMERALWYSRMWDVVVRYRAALRLQGKA